MATYIKAGLYKPGDDDEYEIPNLYIDSEVFQIMTQDYKLVSEITYEELRGIMGIMAAEQEKKHLYIKAKIDKN